ncbi:hypothetical protein HGO53_01305 [Wolbachia endosymbiont of Diaphorina citri]|jgi:hypothetical protein|nr:hypothetical protein [Wolbachia endosymbiont of Diaphorina citri]QJT95005.1 hypothetical protein HGO48_06865 [Wolbachia endosymbiont of Diaphorina citri]QJT96247.1 hypothetical protein HGO49_06930 [Wolbachia endosymbiont of Diaphorina citri]QJT96598.1 hypothetical protein HGO53_01305 [Wolbachia endosymbiont of Diaphorina citri]QLK11700.1 hypothetical protein FK497_05680 [Wolbachia endosymbiont of Diaphorina citri]
MPSSGKFKVKVAKIIRETSSKFDGLNNKMDEVDVTGNNAKWSMCFPY